MTDNKEAELAQLMSTGIKQCIVWYRDQDFSQMNDEAWAELESIFSPRDEYDFSVSLQISVNMMMIGQLREDKRFMDFAARVARTSCDMNTMGKLPGKIALRQVLDDISEVLREPGFYTTEYRIQIRSCVLQAREDEFGLYGTEQIRYGQRQLFVPGAEVALHGGLTAW